MDKATARKLLKGTPVSLGTLKSAAAVFGITNHLELPHPDELVARGVDPSATAPGETVQEWQVEARPTPPGCGTDSCRPGSRGASVTNCGTFR